MTDNPAVYFAPLEGVTDAVYRRAHRASFPGVEKYYMPFVSPSRSMSFTVREASDLSPEKNRGIRAVPQVLAREGDLAAQMIRVLADQGYPEVNLNLGYPVGTVTGKGKGSAMLRDVDGLRRFLDQVYAAPPAQVSVKTRIGWESPEEWPLLAAIYREYPISELTVHPRTRGQFYTGEAWPEALAELQGAKFPVVYNGDLFTAEDCRRLLEKYPWVSALMLGRGLVTNPALARELAGGPPLQLEDITGFHRRLWAAYARECPPQAALGRMRQMMRFFFGCFDAPTRVKKDVLRAKNDREYEDAAEALFDCPMKSAPAFAGI